MRRFFAFPLVRLVLIVAALAAAAAGLSWARASGLGITYAAGTWIVLADLTAAILIVERLTVQRGPAEIGFNPKHLLRDTALGLAAGAALFSLVVLELAALHAYRIDGTHPTMALLYAALWLVPGAAIEELLFRGAIFRLLSEWSGTWIALAVSAVLFGATHLFNPGATWFSTFAIALEAGVLLGAAFVATKNLWLPIALHFAWNFCEGPVYGTQLSGLTVQQPLFQAQISGPAWLTGGSFGPEASVPALLTCSALTAGFLVYAYRTGAIAPCPWFRSAQTSLATAGSDGTAR